VRCPVVLCVDDAEEILEFYQTLLGNYGYAVMVAEDGAEALELFRRRSPQIDAVILDYHMPGMMGLDLAFLLKGLDSCLPVLMVSGDGPKPDEVSPFVDAVIPKGSSTREITDRLELLLGDRAARSQPVT
jgi:DNA-binding response OmpR family regulator